MPSSWTPLWLWVILFTTVSGLPSSLQHSLPLSDKLSTISSDSKKSAADEPHSLAALSHTSVRGVHAEDLQDAAAREIQVGVAVPIIGEITFELGAVHPEGAQAKSSIRINTGETSKTYLQNANQSVVATSLASAQPSWPAETAVFPAAPEAVELEEESPLHAAVGVKTNQSSAEATPHNRSSAALPAARLSEVLVAAQTRMSGQSAPGAVLPMARLSEVLVDTPMRVAGKSPQALREAIDIDEGAASPRFNDSSPGLRGSAAATVPEGALPQGSREATEGTSQESVAFTLQLGSSTHRVAAVGTAVGSSAPGAHESGTSKLSGNDPHRPSLATVASLSNHRLAVWLLVLGVSVLMFGNACFAAGLCISSALWRRSKVGAMRKYVEHLPVCKAVDISSRLPLTGGYDCAWSRPLSSKVLIRIEAFVQRPTTGSQLTAPLTKRTCVLYSSAVSRELHDGVHPVPIAFSFACVNFCVRLADNPDVNIELKGSDVSLFDMHDGRWVEKRSFDRIPDDWQDFISSHRTSPHLSSTLRSDRAMLEFQECTLCVGALVSIVGELHRNANGTLSMRPWNGCESENSTEVQRESWRTSWEDWSCVETSAVMDDDEDGSPKGQSDKKDPPESTVRFDKVMVSDHPELRRTASGMAATLGQARSLCARASSALTKQLA